MQLHVFQHEKQTGPFPLDTVHNMKRTGSLNDTAMLWHEGLADWQPIGPFLATNPPSLFNAFYFGTEGSMMFSLTTHHILQPGVFGQPTTGPEAAVSSWKAVTPTKYVYKVKPGIKFSDGTTLTAADVAFSLNVHRDKKTGSKMFSFFSNVRSVGANQVRNPGRGTLRPPSARPEARGH